MTVAVLRVAAGAVAATAFAALHDACMDGVAQILDPNNQVVQEFVTAPMDEFQLPAQVTGTYSVCLQNSPDTETSKDNKVVMLSVHVGREHMLKSAASLKDAAVSLNCHAALRSWPGSAP